MSITASYGKRRDKLMMALLRDWLRSGTFRHGHREAEQDLLLCLKLISVGVKLQLPVAIQDTF